MYSTTCREEPPQKQCAKSIQHFQSYSLLCLQDSEWSLSDLLPWETLENVKDLTLNLTYTGEEPQWPDDWHQLRSITRLELAIRTDVVTRPEQHPDTVTCSLLPFWMPSLIDLEVTVRFSRFHTSGERELVSLIRCLPNLSRLQVDIERDTRRFDSWDRERQLQFSNLDRYNVICMAVQSEMQVLDYTLKMQKAPGRTFVQLVFNMCMQS